MSRTNLRGKRRRVVVSTDAESSSVRVEAGENFSDRESHCKNACQKENERISATPFLLWHFSPGDKIENCPAQFLAVCWIVHVEIKVHRLRDGFSVSNALLLDQSARLSRKSLTHRQTMMAGRRWERSFLRFFRTWNLQFRNTQCDDPYRSIYGASNAYNKPTGNELSMARTHGRRNNFPPTPQRLHLTTQI